jgi:hypothetical protein
MPESTISSPLLSPQLLAQLERLELVSRKVFRGRMKGERKSKRKGQSVEFADFRQYVPGDDLRFIDWNLFARLERLYLKLFLEEEDLHFYALIDASQSMSFGTPTKLHYAKQLAAALGFIGLVRADRVRIETLSQSVHQPAPIFRGRPLHRTIVVADHDIAADRAGVHAGVAADGHPVAHDAGEDLVVDVQGRACPKMQVVTDPHEVPVGAHDAERAQPRIAPERDAPQHGRAGAGMDQRAGDAGLDARVGEDEGSG